MDDQRDKGLKGWLRRKGGRMNTWSRRWFILKDQLLFIFLKEDDKKCQECIILDGQIIVEPPPDPGDPRQGYFDLVNEKQDKETLSLCAETEEEKKIWVWTLKRVLYAKKGGAIFSQSLEEILSWERSFGKPVHIPYIVNECVEFLYKYGLDVEGLFRLPGRQSGIKETIVRFERGEKIKFEKENTDVHIVASVLKTFLRDLPNSLIPCHLFQKFMNIALRFMEGKDESSKDVCVQELADAMKLIPTDSFIVLKYVCRFLREVGLHESTNKMSMMSLATVFGYNLIRHIDKDNSQLFLCTADLGQHLVYMLLNFFPQVFVLEYSDRGSRNNNVPTADLLRMSRIIDTPAALPITPTLIADLEGINLNIPSSPMDNKKGSNENLKITDFHYSPETRFDFDNDSSIADVLIRSSEFASVKRRDLHLSLSEHGSLSRSYSTPVSPNANCSSPPVPPRRAKSKINRNRFAMDKRPDVKIKVGESLSMDRISPDRVSTEDVLTALTQMKGPSSLPPDSPSTSPASTPSHDSDIQDIEYSLGPNLAAIIEASGKDSTSVTDLQNQVSSLNEELAQQKDHFKSQIVALQTLLTDMKEKYERRIQTMEIEFKSQITELENKLTVEKESYTAAKGSIDRLKTQVHNYHMLFGDLP